MIRFKYKLPKKLVLDVSIWRCGQHPVCDELIPDHNISTCVGDGSTQLLNKEGYMCCLGQFAYGAGVPKEQLLNHSYPEYLGKEFLVKGLVSPFRFRKDGDPIATRFNTEASTINDDTETTVKRKSKLLQTLCKENGIELIVENLIERETE